MTTAAGWRGAARARVRAAARDAPPPLCRRRRAGRHVHPCVSAPAVPGPKFQLHDGAVVGPARSAARGPACSSAAHGPTCGAARRGPCISEEAQPRQARRASRLARGARQWHLTMSLALVQVHGQVTARRPSTAAAAPLDCVPEIPPPPLPIGPQFPARLGLRLEQLPARRRLGRRYGPSGSTRREAAGDGFRTVTCGPRSVCSTR
jgi:hypothetical protein